MPRSLYLDLFPYQRAMSFARQDDYQVITPSHLVSRALNCQHQSLHDLAVMHLAQAEWKIASPLQAQAQFRQAVQPCYPDGDVLSLARIWLPAARSLLQSCSDLSSKGEDLSPRTAQLLAVTRKYQDALHEETLIDGAELYWRVKDVGAIAPRKLLLYGYFQPSADELAWINALAAPGSVIFLPATDSSFFSDTRRSLEWLTQQGWQVQEDCSSANTPGEQLSQRFIELGDPAAIATSPCFAYPTFEAELRGTLAQVKALLAQGVPAREIVLVARDEQACGPQLIDIAWEYGVPLRALYATPLLSTRLGAWLTLLIQGVDSNFPFEATAKLLSHPLCSNPDSGFWAVVRQRHPQGFAQWSAIAAEQLQLDLQALGQARRKRRRDTWVLWWNDLFKTFDLRRRCRRWPREILAFNTLRDALVEFAQPEDEQLNWREFRLQFKELLESLQVPAQPGRGGVELHNPCSVMGARYRHVFAIGMAEGVLPAPIRNDTVLDFYERRQLQTQEIALPTAAQLARTEALDFAFLLQTVEGQLTLSYAKLNDRQEQLPSAYLERLGIESQAPSALPVASPEELRRLWLRQPQSATDLPDDAVLPQAIRAFQVEQRRQGRDRADEYDGIIGIPFEVGNWHFSVSQLTNLGQCPFKWFADKLLKLGEPEEVEEDLNPLQRGNLYHGVLEQMVKVVQADPQQQLTDPILLESAFQAVEEALRLTAIPAWDVRRQEHLRQLALVVQEANFWPEGAEPVELEQKFQGEWQGLQVTGRVDRIDRAADGLVLIDYKTGGKVPTGIKDSNDKACIDLQLPLYQQVAADCLFPEEPVADAYYYSLTKRKPMRASRNAPQHELPAMVERCKQHLASGHYPVSPDTQQTVCTYCSFDAVCRRGDRLTWKGSEEGVSPNRGEDPPWEGQ